MENFYKYASEGDAPGYRPATNEERRCGTCVFFRNAKDDTGYCGKHSFECDASYVCGTWRQRSLQKESEFVEDLGDRALGALGGVSKSLAHPTTAVGTIEKKKLLPKKARSFLEARRDISKKLSGSKEATVFYPQKEAGVAIAVPIGPSDQETPTLTLKRKKDFYERQKPAGGKGQAAIGTAGALTGAVAGALKRRPGMKEPGWFRGIHPKGSAKRVLQNKAALKGGLVGIPLALAGTELLRRGVTKHRIKKISDELEARKRMEKRAASVTTAHKIYAGAAGAGALRGALKKRKQLFNVAEDDRRLAEMGKMSPELRKKRQRRRARLIATSAATGGAVGGALGVGGVKAAPHVRARLESVRPWLAETAEQTARAGAKGATEGAGLPPKGVKGLVWHLLNPLGGKGGKEVAKLANADVRLQSGAGSIGSKPDLLSYSPDFPSLIGALGGYELAAKAGADSKQAAGAAVAGAVLLHQMFGDKSG